MRSRNGTRVRWDASERAQLVQQSQFVLAAKPGESFKDVVAEAMLTLPLERRRKVDTKTVLWVREAVRALPPLPDKAASKLPPSAVCAPAAVTQQETLTEAAAEPVVSQPAPAASPLTAALIDTAVDVLVGILSDPRLKLALRELLAQPSPSKANDDKRLVLVAGLQPGDAKTVERNYGGMLPVRTWTTDQTREQLEAYVNEASLVIGMQDQLTQAIESSLRRLGDRYVPNTGGLQGLHKRLAEEAMR